MAYCRWSEDSDLYIFEHVSGYLECCGCTLVDSSSDSLVVRPSEWYDTPSAMITHVQEHIAAGHRVPDYVIPDLAARDNPEEQKRRVLARVEYAADLKELYKVIEEKRREQDNA